MAHDRDLVGQGGVELVVGPVLEGGDIELLAPADVGPHVHGLRHAGAPEVVVPDGPAAQAHPGALEDQVLAVQHVGPGRDIQAGGLGEAAGAVVVQGVDALEDGYFVLAQAEGRAHMDAAHLAGKLELGHPDGLTLGQQGKVMAQEVHVHALGGLEVDHPVCRPGGGLGVEGLEVVVHGDGVGVDATLLQFFLNFQGGGGLAGAGGAGQQDDGAVLQVVQDHVGRSADLGSVLGVGLLQETLYVLVDAAVDLPELIAHGLFTGGRDMVSHDTASFQAGQGQRSHFYQDQAVFSSTMSWMVLMYSWGYLGLAIR